LPATTLRLVIGRGLTALSSVSWALAGSCACRCPCFGLISTRLRLLLEHLRRRFDCRLGVLLQSARASACSGRAVSSSALGRARVELSMLSLVFRSCRGPSEPESSTFRSSLTRELQVSVEGRVEPRERRHVIGTGRGRGRGPPRAFDGRPSIGTSGSGSLFGVSPDGPWVSNRFLLRLSQELRVAAAAEWRASTP